MKQVIGYYNSTYTPVKSTIDSNEPLHKIDQILVETPSGNKAHVPVADWLQVAAEILRERKLHEIKHQDTDEILNDIFYK